MTNASISVTTATNDGGWTFGVQVAQPNGQTRHQVTLTQQDFTTLTDGKAITPEDLIRRSFEFLLERGAKESIQRQFDLPAITRFFPEYPAEIRKRI